MKYNSTIERANKQTVAYSWHEMSKNEGVYESVSYPGIVLVSIPYTKTVIACCDGNCTFYRDETTSFRGPFVKSDAKVKLEFENKDKS